MARIGVVDIGSNSTSAAVFDLRADGIAHRVAVERTTNRLHRRLEGGRLGPDAIAQLVDEVAGLVARAGPSDRWVAVATSAVRDAANRDDVVVALGRVLPTRWLTGEAEGRYAALAAVRSLPLRGGRVCDQGGGSLQVVGVADGVVGEAFSYPLGAVRLLDVVGRPDRLDAVARAAIRRRVAQHVRGRVEGEVVAVGGGVRTLGRIVRKEVGWPLEHAHGLWLSLDVLQDLTDRLCREPAARRRRIPGLPADRVDTAPVAAVVWTALVEQLGATGLRVCALGVREGVAIEASGVAVPAEPVVAALGVAVGVAVPEVGERAARAWARAVALAEAVGADGAAAGLLAWVAVVSPPDAVQRLREDAVPLHRAESVVAALEALAGRAPGLAALAEAAAAHADVGSGVRREGDVLRVRGPRPGSAREVERVYGVRWAAL